MSEQEHWYLYVNKKSLRISRISPISEDSEDDYLTLIDAELGIEFVNSPHLINDYVVYYDGVKINLLKKEKTKNVITPFFYSPILIKENAVDPQLIVDIRNKKFNLRFKKEILQYAASLYSSTTANQRHIAFYISEKDDPNVLLDVIKVDVDRIFSGEDLDIPFDFDAENISIFTRKIFDSYGLRC